MFLKDKKFWINSLGALAALILISLLIFKGFDWYTRHGTSVEVPDLTGMTLEEAKKELEKRGFIVETVDSLYDLPAELKDKKIDFGDVIMQNPKPKEKVKKGRRFYLMIRTSVPPMVEMPDLVDLSLRQAISTIEAKGLVFGKAIPKPGLPPVMKQLYKGQVIKPGTKIPKGSVIDVWVGRGDGEDIEVPIPNLIGMTRSEAIKALGNSGLLPEGEVFVWESKTKDSSNAVVTRQSPTPNEEDRISQGSGIDLWYKGK